MFWSGLMPRIVSVWLPYWPIERLRRADPGAVPDEGPFALVAPGRHGITITAANAAARAAHVAVGAALADVRAALPVLATRPAEPTRDCAALRTLARWCGRYGPARNTHGADGLWIDVTGVAHLFGGEQGLVEDLGARLAALALTARIGLADTLGAAFALARHGGRSIAFAPPGGTQTAVAALPVAGLRLDADTLKLLRRLGLRRIGQLYDLPRAALERRFRSAETAGPCSCASTRHWVSAPSRCGLSSMWPPIARGSPSPSR
jgi:protein ImuB